MDLSRIDLSAFKEAATHPPIDGLVIFLLTLSWIISKRLIKRAYKYTEI